MECAAKDLNEIASYFRILASDQLGCIRFQPTKKAKEELKIKAAVWNDAADILEKTKLTG